ncbi:MAG TPA: hypothetical protein VNE58_05135 [Casimicrobiaceae bacterium]|nr:hypothetical protein [Casimicrobiaceae bacterium]
MVVELEHPTLGTLNTVALPILFDGERNRPGLAPPRHGEHTRTILGELGYSAAEIDGLVARRIAFAGSGER